MKLAISIILLFVLAPRSLAGIEDLQKKFSGVNDFEVLIDLTKFSRILSQPLKSRIRLTLKANTVIWHTLTPVETKLIMDDQGLRGPDKLFLPKSGLATRRVRAVAQMISAMIRGDITVLKQDFDISWENLTLTAIPRKGYELDFFQMLRIVFSKDLEPIQFDYLTEQESSTMKFSEVNYGRYPGLKP